MSLIFSIIISFGITALLKEVDVINAETSLNCTVLLIFPIFIMLLIFMQDLLQFVEIPKINNQNLCIRLSFIDNLFK